MSVSARPDACEAECEPLSLPPHELAELVIESLDASGGLAPQSFERLSGIMRGFASFVERACGFSVLSEVGIEHARAFLEASTRTGSPPAVATKHLRRSAIRLLYREAARLGAVSEDPTTDLPLPPRSYLPIRPLTDDEVELCRSFARSSLSATRKPAAWALSEASARSSELLHIRVRDVDLDGARVRIAGGARTAARWGELTEWGLIQVARRLSALRRDGRDAPLVCSDLGNPASARANAYEAIDWTLVRAGLGGEPDVRPNSLVAWRGASALAAGASIDEVARLLGIRSLDAAASFIGWDWQEQG